MTEEPSDIAKFFGAAMMAAGALIMLGSGACTGYLLIAMAIRGQVEAGVWVPVLGFGLLFILFGYACFVRGRSTMRGDRH